MFKDGKLHEKRSAGDFKPILNIRGPKFDIPYSDKKKLFENCQDDINWLKANWGIDYSNVQEPQVNSLNYELTKETIGGIKKAYFNPELSRSMRNLIIEYLKIQLKNRKNGNNELLIQLLSELGF